MENPIDYLKTAFRQMDLEINTPDLAEMEKYLDVPILPLRARTTPFPEITETQAKLLSLSSAKLIKIVPPTDIKQK